jgi:hypothetical protein
MVLHVLYWKIVINIYHLCILNLVSFRHNNVAMFVINASRNVAIRQQRQVVMLATHVSNIVG